MAGQLRFGEGWRVRMLVVSTKCSVPQKVSKNIVWNRLLKRAMWTKMTGWKPSWPRSTKNWTNDVCIECIFCIGFKIVYIQNIYVDLVVQLFSCHGVYSSVSIRWMFSNGRLLLTNQCDFFWYIQSGNGTMHTWLKPHVWNLKNCNPFWVVV